MENSALRHEISGELDAIKVGIGVIVIILFGFLAAYSMASGGTTSENKPVVVATANNLGYFAEEIGGEEVEVRAIVKAGACPGHYQAKTSDVNTIANAELILWNGLETWIKDLIASSGNNYVYLFSIDESIENIVNKLNNENVSKRLREIHERNYFPLSENVSVSVEENGESWRIEDKTKTRTYYARTTKGKLKIYTNLILNKAPAGPWGPPWGAKKYIENVTDALTLIYPQHKEVFEERENKLISKINSCAENLKEQAMAKNVSETEVICQQFQNGFVEWLGFNVVKTFPSPEQLSAKQVGNLIRIAKNRNVAIVISNNPSILENDTLCPGSNIASEAGIEHVILSNFPGSRGGEDTYCEMIRSNAERLFSAKEAYES